MVFSNCAFSQGKAERQITFKIVLSELILKLFEDRSTNPVIQLRGGTYNTKSLTVLTTLYPR